MERMPIEAIKPLFNTLPIDGIKALGSTGALSGMGEAQAQAGGTIFGDIFQSAIDNVRQTDAEKNEKEYLLAIGELDNPAELTIALSKFATASDMMIQLRNKALDAYSEVMRISL